MRQLIRAGRLLRFQVENVRHMVMVENTPSDVEQQTCLPWCGCPDGIHTSWEVN